MSADGSHLGWRSGSPDTILKVDYLRNIHARLRSFFITGVRLLCSVESVKCFPVYEVYALFVSYSCGVDVHERILYDNATSNFILG